MGIENNMFQRALAFACASTILAGCGSSASSSVDNVTKAAARAAETVKAELASKPQAGWEKSELNSAMDGREIIVAKEFEFPDKSTLIRVILQCKQQNKDLIVSIESYALGDGPKAQGSPFVAGGIWPVGRVKLGVRAPIALEEVFRIDKYSNVLSWNVRSAVRDARASLKLAKDNLPIGNNQPEESRDRPDEHARAIADETEEVVSAEVGAVGAERPGDEL